MAWIEEYNEVSLINSDMIERIYWEMPGRLKDPLNFFAEINGMPHLIFTMYVPERIIEKTKDNPSYFEKNYHKREKLLKDDYRDSSPEILDVGERVFDKIMSIIIEAKRMDNDQIIHLKEKISVEAE
jgi:hypothetical protein